MTHIVTCIFPVPVCTFGALSWVMKLVLTPHDDGRMADYPSLASVVTGFISR